MVRYAKEPESAEKSAKARGHHLRVHFKHMREVSHNIKGMECSRAVKFLEDVLQFKRAVVFTKFTGGVGRHAQGKLVKAPGDKVRWPQKATKIVLNLLKNAMANAETKGLEAEDMVIAHIQCNRAPQQRRRTYRAHGRINAYMSSPAHIELYLEEKPEPVAKGPQEPVKITRKQMAKRRFVKVGGGVVV